MFRKLRRNILKMLAFIDYFEEPENTGRFGRNYRDMGRITFHTPIFIDKSMVYIFEEFEDLTEFVEECANQHPAKADGAVHKILSVTPFTAKNGITYLFTSTIRCSCTFCLTKSSWEEKYFKNEIREFNKRHKLGLLLSNKRDENGEITEEYIAYQRALENMPL